LRTQHHFEEAISLDQALRDAYEYLRHHDEKEGKTPSEQ
jgi:hypothetical protein